MMEKYNPPPGISLIFLEWMPKKEEVIVEFVTSSLQPDPIYRKNMNDIRHELGLVWRDRLLQDDLRQHEKSPRRAMVVESILNHPFITGDTKGIDIEGLLPAGVQLSPRELKKAAEEAVDTKEIKMSPQQAEEQIRLGSTGQKLNIQPVEVRQERRLEQILSMGGEKAEYREVYGPEENVYLQGVLDSG